MEIEEDAAARLLERLKQGARNCVRLGGAAEGEDVAIVASHDVDALIVEELVAAVRETGAKPMVLLRDPPPQGGGPSALHAAALRSSLAFELGPPMAHTQEGFLAVFDHGARQISLHPDRLVLQSDAAQLPLDIFFAISRRVQSALRKGRDLLVTDSRGSRLSLRVEPGHVGAFIGPEPYVPGPAVPGYMGMFPPGGCVWGDLGYSATGTLVLDAADAHPQLSEPIQLTFEAGWVKAVDGGAEARELAAYIFGRRNGNRLAEVGIGLNPAASREPLFTTGNARTAVLLMTRAAGSMFIGIGSDAMQGGVDVAEGSPAFGVALRPTILAGDALIATDGRLSLLDHPDDELRDLAIDHGVEHLFGRRQ